ncbi:primosomal protein N' [Kocuria sp.]|uniref:primosomal protein N' family DNA-binding protein n=1 Tax=Kocuria sp. TaxID=1871328 RepID=UPI0026DEE1B5|nr:primosomal protein N' [Kocuria sp.]MDO5617674.1 primosomal protein N' [Kocuria sp.]
MPEPLPQDSTDSVPETGAEQLELLDLPGPRRGDSGTARAGSKSGQATARGGNAAARSGQAAARRGQAKAAGHDHTPAYLAEELPVARVILESHVPHLDRSFDYGVPRDLADQAQPGTRVRVRFGGQQMMGWLIERAVDSEVSRDRLQPLQRVISACPVLTPETLEVARLVAARTAGLVPDVLRAAIPPRVAAVEKAAAKPASSDQQKTTGELTGTGELLAAEELESGDGTTAREATAARDATGPDPVGAFEDVAEQEAAALRWADYHNGTEVWDHLNADTSGAEAAHPPVRAVLQAMPGQPKHSYLDLVAQAMAATHLRGQGAVAVVPDAKTLDRLQSAVQALVSPDAVARLHSDDKPTPRYRAFMQVLHGQRTVVLGTRPAVWAPVHNLGLIVVVNDSDSNLVEQRAPYHHARDVALLRSEHQGVGLMFASHTVTPEAQRLVDTGWATAVYPHRDALRRRMPRIVATADSWYAGRDSLAGRARLPETAFRIAREALERGPVLVQVARAGYVPSIACDRCRAPARCSVCEGPLKITNHGGLPVCGWCSREALAWSCAVCSGTRWRTTAVGTHRTAEELGRAFPQIPVIASSGDHVRRTVTSEPALVVATPGAEPWAERGYAAALLLDGDRMLSRPGLRAEEETLHRWFEASALVQSGATGGTVVVTSEHVQAVNTLIRWDPAGHAVRELGERRALQLPPAVRCAALTGPAAALGEFMQLLNVEQLQHDGTERGIRVIGPAPLGDSGVGDSGMGNSGTEQDHRTLLFFPYALAAEVTGRLRSARAEASALRRFAPVNVRCDVADLL